MLLCWLGYFFCRYLRRRWGSFLHWSPACLCVSSEWRMFVNGGRISTHWMILWPKQKYVSVCVGYSQQTSDDDYSIENILLALCSPIFRHYSFLSVGVLQDVEENDFTAGGGVGKSSYTQREGEWEHRELYAFVVSPLVCVCVAIALSSPLRIFYVIFVVVICAFS